MDAKERVLCQMCCCYFCNMAWEEVQDDCECSHGFNIRERANECMMFQITDEKRADIEHSLKLLAMYLGDIHRVMITRNGAATYRVTIFMNGRIIKRDSFSMRVTFQEAFNKMGILWTDGLLPIHERVFRAPHAAGHYGYAGEVKCVHETAKGRCMIGKGIGQGNHMCGGLECSHKQLTHTEKE